MGIIQPFGGALITLLKQGDAHIASREKAKQLKTLQLSARSLCDLELLAIGAFSPLNQFMGSADYKSVLTSMRLANGTLFPIPITLPVSHNEKIQIGEEITLINEYNTPLAIMKVEEKYAWDQDEEAQSVLQTTDSKHPLVKEMETWGKYYIAGKLEVFALPHHADFKDYRYTPAALRKILTSINNPNVVAFQTRNPMHRAHEELTKRAMHELGAVLLLQPVVGLTKPRDVDHYTRVRIYKTLLEKYYDEGQAILSLLPLAMRMAGPREALLHAIIRRNYGANHFIVGRDHASPGNNSQGKPFYGPYDAQELTQLHQQELGIKIVSFNEFVYIPDEHCYEDRTKVPSGTTVWTISGTQVREDYLSKGIPLPSWFTREECARILAEAYPPKHQRGTCLWFTGLPSAGKTTIATILCAKLNELGKIVTFCDGDVIRKFLANGLGYSLGDRATYLKRLGFIAAEVTRHRGIVIVAAVSPLKETRRHIREEVNNAIGNFIEIFVDTPLEICKSRDIKGMYAKADKGEIQNFTGVSSPYESPEDPEIKLISDKTTTPGDNAQTILNYLRQQKILLC